MAVYYGTNKVTLSGIKSVYYGNNLVYSSWGYPVQVVDTLYITQVFNAEQYGDKLLIDFDAWTQPTVTLADSVISTPIVSNVTKYKVYDNGVYIGYIDSDGNFYYND